MTGKGARIDATGLSEAFSRLLDPGVENERLEQMARLTAAKYWRRPDDEEWGRTATFLFRTASDWWYAVFPIYRRRYYAVVRIDRDDTAGAGAVRSDMFEVRAITVLEHDALKIATAEIAGGELGFDS